MKERPILFSGAMVRAILEGRKTQTRRVVKYVPALGEPEEWCHRFSFGSDPIIFNPEHHCKYGAVGERLWVRETWADCGDKTAVMRADCSVLVPGVRWRPSIHMPRWASRITLEIIGVRVERLQDISDEDAMAEGCQAEIIPPNFQSYRAGYATLWDAINGPGAWDKNPWVWVIEFKWVEA